MSEEDKKYIALRVKDMPIPPIPCFKLVCSGGCGEEVWVDKNTERIWSKVPVLCMDCAMKSMESGKEELRLSIAPESVFMMKKFLEDLNSARLKLMR